MGSARLRTLTLAARVVRLRYHIKLLLRLFPLDDCLIAITPAGQRPPDPPTPRREHGTALAEIEEVTDMVLRRFRPTRTTCLVRALTRYVLIRNLGIPARFVTGLRPEGDGDIIGHAWVTVDDEPVMERKNIERYRVSFAHP